MKGEILYSHSVWKGKSRIEEFTVPRMDADEELMRALGKTVFKSDWTGLFQQDFRKPIDTCPFAERGSASVRWDGKISPCLPLLHAHENFLEDTQRTINPYFTGTLEESSLLSVWNDEAFAGLREKLQDFDFSPCTECNSCEMAEGNEEDCFGSNKPTCGGCLWAQGFISCP
jgi:MoaA/NifB/PqqE/SkfB family radical SAM enzyme